jgi:hypothetical protein
MPALDDFKLLAELQNFTLGSVLSPEKIHELQVNYLLSDSHDFTEIFNALLIPDYRMISNDTDNAAI